MLFFVALCIVAGVAARAVFPKEIKGELHDELEELKEHGHHDGVEEKPIRPETPDGEEKPSGPEVSEQEVEDE